MTREDIKRMAEQAGLPTAWISEKGVLKWSDLERFAKLAYEAGAAAERERWGHLLDNRAARCERAAENSGDPKYNDIARTLMSVREEGLK